MNVTWRLPSEELEAEFVAEAKKAGLVGLKGHRSVGGLRASIYNAVPKDAIEALVVRWRDQAIAHKRAATRHRRDSKECWEKYRIACAKLGIAVITKKPRA